MQITHCAPNYAAVLSLCTIGTPEALQLVDRPAMYHYFLSLKDPCGGFAIHSRGEVDSRGTYTVISIARILNIMTPELVSGVADFILQCQTYEGGFGGEPGNEAHGGYNYCAVAVLLILNASHRCDLFALEGWLLRRQVRLEGGFQGRTNKLVDSCYSFWQGAALAMVEIMKIGGSDIYDMEQYIAHSEACRDDDKTATTATVAADSVNGSNSSSGGGSHGSSDPAGQLMEVEVEVHVNLDEAKRIQHVDDTSGSLAFNQNALQRYILHCAQNLEGGGLRDKPGKSRDFYHSCYALSGLSISQSCITTALRVDLDGNPEERSTGNSSNDSGNNGSSSLFNELPQIELDWSAAQVYGDFDNLLEPTSAVFNIGLDRLNHALKYYATQPSDHAELLSLYAAKSSS